MARAMDFRKPRLREYSTPSSLCLCQYPPKISHCSRNRISVSSGKGLHFITNYVFLLLECDGNYNFTRHKLFDANRHTLVTRRGCCYINEKNGLTKTFFADEIAALFVLKTTIRERS